MRALVEHARCEALSDQDIAYLATSLANASGRIWNNLNPAADVASTGGPTSLSTLICPLYLRALGYAVPKLGVPGRPAGGIDVLAQIPGFKFSLTDSEAIAVLKQAGYVHFLADEAHGWHDALLFTYRKRHHALDVAPLVIASLLAKKLIAGLLQVGLDIRVSAFGNFGKTWNEARINAQRFCRVASFVGISAVCFLTDGSLPYQPYVGRGESLVALSKIFEGTGCKALNDHLAACYLIARGTIEARLQKPTPDNLRFAFEANLRAQGTSMQAFSEMVSSIVAKNQFTLTSSEEGFLQVDIEALRRLLVSRQELYVSQTKLFPDPAGIILKKHHQDYVKREEEIATVRTTISDWEGFRAELKNVLRIGHTPGRNPRFEEIRNA